MHCFTELSWSTLRRWVENSCLVFFTMCGATLLICLFNINFFSKCYGITDPISMENSRREEIITHYFHSGLSYTEIISFLFVYHGITLRQLNRILRKLGLSRRKFKALITSVISAIETELVSSSASFGYRMMHQKLGQKKLVVDRETVWIALRYLDPDGVTARSRHILHRRVYNARGANYVWHVDDYDRIKPYGFAIHTAIDGYSRKILWLKVLARHDNPKMIGTLYLNYFSQSEITPGLVRSDRGSENVVIAGLQRYFIYIYIYI